MFSVFWADAPSIQLKLVMLDSNNSINADSHGNAGTCEMDFHFSHEQESSRQGCANRRWMMGLPGLQLDVSEGGAEADGMDSCNDGWAQWSTSSRSLTSVHVLQRVRLKDRKLPLIWSLQKTLFRIWVIIQTWQQAIKITRQQTRWKVVLTWLPEFKMKLWGIVIFRREGSWPDSGAGPSVSAVTGDPWAAGPCSETFDVRFMVIITHR